MHLFLKQKGAELRLPASEWGNKATRAIHTLHHIFQRTYLIQQQLTIK